MTYATKDRFGTPSDRTAVAGQNAALLIDFDNVTLGIRSDLQLQLRRLLNSDVIADVIRGKVAVQRAYADWRRYPQYIVPLSEASIDLIFAPAFGSNKKNATDIRLAIDALELVFTRPEIGTFILLSGDSDFSSLVLKLKEYGKFIIGVGLRESASDLLVQNCDEYYSYSELTGLAKEVDAAPVQRDPWEVVVNAVVKMRDGNDVMRSDRLKQVMQEIDPHFDEKDAGFNKFSKFVIEAARRGLLQVEKMENGQYLVGVGPDANDPVKESRGTTTVATKSDSRVSTPGARDVAAGAQQLSLDAAFDLLRAALTKLDAQKPRTATAERVREQMVQLADNEDPLLDAKRFQRLLRQAHDADIVDLTKDGDVYLLTLRPTVTADLGDEDVSAPEPNKRPVKKARKKTKKSTATTTATETTPAPEVPPATDEDDASTGAEKPAIKKRTRKRAKAKPKTEDVELVPSAEPAQTRANQQLENVNVPTPPVGPPTRSVTGRLGSRGRRPARTPQASARPSTKPSEDESAPPAKPISHVASLGGRGSSRTRRSKQPTDQPAPSNKAEPSPVVSDRQIPSVPPPPPVAETSPVPAAPSIAPPVAAPTTRDAIKPKSATPTPPPSSDDNALDDEGDGGLLKRMAKAFQRAVMSEEETRR